MVKIAQFGSDQNMSEKKMLHMRQLNGWFTMGFSQVYLRNFFSAESNHYLLLCDIPSAARFCVPLIVEKHAGAELCQAQVKLGPDKLAVTRKKLRAYLS